MYECLGKKTSSKKIKYIINKKYFCPSLNLVWIKTPKLSHYSSGKGDKKGMFNELSFLSYR
jgi:hypothetical protein